MKSLLILTLAALPAGAGTLNPALLVRFDGSLTGTAYTLGAGEIDTTGTFVASGTPTLSGGSAALDGGTSNDGFQLNPASLGALTTQNWVAEAIVSFDAFQGGQRTMIDIQGDTDFRVNNAANGLEANFWDGAPANPNITAPLPGTGVSAHYALVWNATTKALTAYIDGVSIGSTSGSGAFNTPDAANVSFGYLGRAGLVGRSIDGALDAVAFATFTGTFDPATDLQLFTPEKYVFWDTDGATPGAGGAFPDGNWGDANWSASAAGDAATAGWIDGDNAAFSAGTDATGAYAIALGSGTRRAGSLLVEEGDVMLNGGALEIAADGAIEAATGARLTIASALSASDLKSSGDVELSGATTISGGLRVASGHLLLDLPVTVGALSGGGAIDIGDNAFTAGGAVDSSYSGILSGTGPVTKAGGGSLTLGSLSNSFSGPLTVAAGTLVTGPAPGGGITSYLGAVDGSREITVQSGATLRLTQANVFGGAGKTAAGIPHYRIDGGTLRTIRFNIAGDTVLSNGATLANASTEVSPSYGGFQFLGSVTASGGPAPCQILDDGSARPIHLLGGAETAFNVEDLTASAAADLIVSSDLANGSGDYPGIGSLAKTGPGTLSLTGANTYSGNTAVSAGTLTLDSGAQLRFVLGAASGVNNSISGAGTAVINGNFAIDTTAAAALSTGSWILENVSSLTGAYGASFTVVGFTDAGSDKWTKSDASGLWTFDETTGVLTLSPPAGYSSWASTNGVPGQAAKLDHDSDGVPNGIEYFLGGPSGHTTGFTPLPGVTTTAGVRSVTWTKGPGYLGTYGADFVIETSSALAGVWTVESLGGNVTASGNNVTYTFPAGPPKNFARLKVTGP